jgi:serine/threonine-protein kinase
MGKTISHYRLDEEIGQGGMGSVYKAYDQTLDRTVVLKILADDLMTEEFSRKRFLREARLASALDHPNICTIYETAEADDQFFIAMQFIEGKTLKRVIGGRPLNIDLLLAIALQVADALASAHSKGIVHRDVKSGNIIITPRGQAKVLDFGLAKLMSEKGRAAEPDVPADELTRMGAPLGTPSYMSPEQALGERVDHRSDIYSFGVVLYEMTAGRLPFRASSSVDMMHAVVHDAPKPVREFNTNAPEELAAIISHSMAKDPGDRYQSMQQMLEDLQTLSVALRIGAQGVPDGITVPYVAPRRSGSRNPIGRLFNKLFARKEGAGSYHAQSMDRRAESSQDSTPTSSSKKTLAVLPFRNLSGEAEADFYGLSMADHLITELGNVKSLTLTPSSSVARYQNQSIDPTRVRSELGVDLILTGNFLKSGERLRVTAQLVDARGGGILWSEKIDAAAQDALDIQDHISREIVAGLSREEVAVDPMLLLKDENEEMRLDAVRTLEFSHDPRALSALVEAMRDASLKVKSEAVTAIVKLGADGVGPVIQLLNDSVDEEDYLTARYAAKALGLTGDRSISQVLIGLLDCEDNFVACEAALALGRLKEQRAVSHLVKMLEDPNGNKRFAAAEALGHICDTVSREALRRRLSDDDEGVRAKARWALNRIRITDRGSRQNEATA